MLAFTPRGGLTWTTNLLEQIRLFSTRYSQISGLVGWLKLARDWISPACLVNPSRHDRLGSDAQSEADRQRSLGNNNSVCGREPHNPGLHHAPTVSFRVGPRGETVWMEDYCCLHDRHSNRQQHPGKQ